MGEDSRATSRRTTERPTERKTVAQAAEVLGISAEAVRGRIRRGTLPVEREGGTVYVLLDPSVDDRTTDEGSRTTADQPTDQPQSESTALISEMRDRIESLERQLEQERQANSEHRRLLMAALERIPPQLEAPQEPAEAAETVGEEPERPEPRSDAPGREERPAERPWWRRVFGG